MVNFSDLKDMDASQLVQIFSEKKETVINAVIVVVGLVVLLGLFNDYRQKDQVLRQRLTQIQTKNDAISARDQSVKDLRAFSSALPQGLQDYKIITQITTYAKSHHIAIVSLSPAQRRSMGLYDVTKVHLSAEAKDFKEMVLFLRDIEKSKFALRVDSWKGSLQGSSGQAIGCEIDISAINIKT